MSNASRESSVKGKVLFSRLHKAAYQKEGSLTLEVKQIITKTSYYAAKKFNSDLQDGLFDDSAFGAEEKEYKSNETRVAWIQVPEGKNEAEMKRMLIALPNSCIYKILSNAPILDSNQKTAIDNGLKDLEDFANSQVARYPKGSELEGEVILDDAGKVQYRRTFFSKIAKEDIDLRGNGDEYVTDAILEELQGAGISYEQTI
jgi:hypothetical protein